jgi:hypothetical protein
MYTTTDGAHKPPNRIRGTAPYERGILNNYAVEPSMTYQEYPKVWEQKNYLKQGALALLLVTALVFTSVAVS